MTILDSVQNSLIATMAATTCTNFIDVAITRYQVVDSSKGRLSFRQVVRDVVRTDGLRGLNRGIGIKLMYRGLDTCIYLPVYEEFRKKFGYDFSKASD